MQTQYVLKQAGLSLPVTKLFQQHIVTLLAEQSQQTSVRAVVINFRDPDYSAESGGFHPVEMRFIRQDNEWYFDYVTDFSYIGRVYPELEKEMDFCWSGQYVFHYLAGDISLAAERNELWSLWEGNFMDYLSMGIYRVTVTVESC
ncbi:DUF2787 domain-containing protein [Enterobacter hormaechei]|uniref:DUF2787 family protein n=1 Tax=Enterobacter hormaechei TaxID=158836 RepID=UPI0012FADDFE|nr:DUF2787 family protein [Enterobacter hormaechei]QGU36028.1 DUF2787 domain-containing protein [Enterobacter hormaechei]